MLTRRAVLGATAAASIAVIATSRGVAAAESEDGSGWGPGYGDLKGGGVGAFQKRSDGFGVFLKWDGGGAEVFYKEGITGDVAVFYKSFVKGWTPTTTVFLKAVDSLQGADAWFSKVHAGGAEFFLKAQDGKHVVTTFEAGENGVDIDIEENYND